MYFLGNTTQISLLFDYELTNVGLNPARDFGFFHVWKLRNIGGFIQVPAPARNNAQKGT